MFQNLEEITSKFNLSFSEKDKLIEKEIVNIFNGNFDKSNLSFNDDMLIIIGLYYKYVEINYDLMKIYYLI